jgi:ATP-dependent DNA helicase RecQ
MSSLVDALSHHFGPRAFRAGQEALVRAVVEGRDLLVVMPTGSGKSLGYQLPAVVLPGTTIVVSPLISLMNDQVDELGRRGIAAAAPHSMLGADERRDGWRQAWNGSLRLLYAAPKRFASDARRTSFRCRSGPFPAGRPCQRRYAAVRSSTRRAIWYSSSAVNGFGR